MASTKEQLERIDSRLDTIEQALALRPKPTSRWRAAYEWVINHKGTSAILSILLFVGGPFLAYRVNHSDDKWNRAVDDRVNAILNSEGGVRATLARVDATTSRTETKIGTLEPFIQDVVRHQFENASNLPASVLRERLPAVNNLIAIAQSQHVSVQPNILNNLSKKLLQVEPESNDFWNVAGSLISYRSANTASWTTPSKLPIDCVHTEPSRTANVMPTGVIIDSVNFSNCRLTLDSPEDTERLNKYLKGDFPVAMFEHCLVVYRGGVVKIPFVWNRHSVASTVIQHKYRITGPALLFHDCLFDFSIKSTPSVEAQQLAKSFLSQDELTLRLSIAPKAQVATP